MESQGASPRTTAEECRRWVRKADVFVGLLGMRYGSKEKASAKSFTEIEFDEATTVGKPCLMYLIDEQRHLLAPKWMDTSPDADALSALKKRVGALVKADRFSSPDNVAHKVLRDLTIFLAEQGWPDRPKIRGIETKELPPTTAPGLELPLDSCASKPYFLPLNTPNDDVRADIAAGLMSGMFRRGDFAILRDLVSISRPVWDSLAAFLRGTRVDEDRLAVEILRTSDAFYLRLLVMIAGEISAATCVEAIAVRMVVDGKEIDEALRGYRHSMRSFRDVVRGALSNMPFAVVPILERSRDNSRGRRWQAHQLFAKAIREIQKRSPPNPDLQPTAAERS